MDGPKLQNWIGVGKGLKRQLFKCGKSAKFTCEKYKRQGLKSVKILF